jgi:hypothetical protein
MAGLEQAGRTWRAGGIVLTVLGGGLVTAGIVVAGVTRGSLIEGWAPLGGFGLVGLVSGVPLWVLGQQKINQARAYGRLSLAPAPAGASGASLRLDF